MKKLLAQLPLSLTLFVVFNTLLSLISLPITFVVPVLLLMLTAFYAGSNKNTTLIRAVAYLLAFVGLALIWQSLEIPSLIALAAVLMLLTWAKACEIKSTRDHKVIWLLSTVLLAIDILLLNQYQLIVTFVGITFLLLSATAINQLLPVKINTLTNKLAAKQLVLLTLTSLPFALILFITLPRINLPMQELGLAMGLPIAVQPQENIAGKGLGKELGFNDIGNKAQSDSRVLLATLPADFTLTEDKPLYWRGPVYWLYSVESTVERKVESTGEKKVESKVEAKAESNAETASFEEKWLLRDGFNNRSKRQYNGFGSNKAVSNMANKRENTLEYSVILMPHGEYWLYGLDLPATLTGESYLSQDYQLLSIRTVDTLWRYKIKSSLSYQISEKEPQAQLSLGLTLPENNPKLLALGKQWQQQFAENQHSAQSIIKHAEQFFKQGKYLYANSGELYTGQHQLDQFIFSRKMGTSQHYASALTLLLRAANIPARLVAGYRGAEKVGLTNLYAVNESHGHAWVEAYYPNSQGQKSWQRIDPALWLSDLFSSGNKQKTEQDAQQETVEQDKLAATENNPNEDIIKQSKNSNKHQQSSTSWLDGLSQWTLDFDADKQSTLASKLGIKHLLWWHLVAIALGLLLLLALTIYVTLRHINRSKKLPVHVQVYHKLCKKLAKKGLTRLPYEGAQSYFARCATEQSLQAHHFQQLSHSYLKIAYGKLNEQEQRTTLNQFKQLAAQI